MSSFPATASRTVSWRPSRHVVVALCGLGMLGALGAWASDMPRDIAAVVGAGSVALGVLRARRECHRPTRVLVLAAPGGARLDGEPLASLDVHFRGPLAFLVARDAAGRAHRLAFWPDVLDAEGRRVLRLASTTRDTPAVAG